MISTALAGILMGTSLAVYAQAQASPDTTAPSAEQQQTAAMQKLLDRWDDAVGQRDQYGLELVLAPQFVDITDTGSVLNRDQVVSAMVHKGAERYTLAQKAVNVREVGDVAVVTGTYDREYPGSRLSRVKAKSEQGVFSQVYIRARDSWECINSQRTLIAMTTEKSNKKKKTRYQDKDKPLHHDLGFHFPGLHHSDNTNPTPQG